MTTMDNFSQTQESFEIDGTPTVLKGGAAVCSKNRLTNTGTNYIFHPHVSQPSPLPPRLSLGGFFNPSDDIYYRKLKKGRENEARRSLRNKEVAVTRRNEQPDIFRMPQLVVAALAVYLLLLTAASQPILHTINKNKRSYAAGSVAMHQVPRAFPSHHHHTRSIPPSRVTPHQGTQS